MAHNVSQIFVLLAGISLCMFSVWGFFAPERLSQLVKTTIAADWGIYFAVIVRLMLGVALIVAAPESLFPMAFLIVGWIAIVAAAAAAFIGRERLRRIMDWFLERFTPSIIRLWLLIGMAFGGFLIYGVS